MKIRFVTLGLLIAAARSFASPMDHSCMVQTCSAGDKAITYATKSDPYYACPTRELASYTAFVIGLIALNISLTGNLPNISDKTGEPEYPDDASGPNRTRVLLDRVRAKAKVATFDQALSMCAAGPTKLRVTVMNNPSDETVIWVRDDKRKVSFWMPKSSLDKQ